MPKAKIEDVNLPEEEENVEEPQTQTDGAGDKGGNDEPPAAAEEEYDSYNMDPNAELWEGGPKFAQINAWKEQFGDIFVTSITPDKHYVWRTLSRFEYRRLVKNLEQAIATGQVSQGEANMNNEESIAEMCILFPMLTRAEGAGELAGVASTIAQQVMQASGFGDGEVRQL